MREIKFRGWDYIQKSFCYLVIPNDSFPIMSNLEGRLPAVKEWQQFTGLQDKYIIDIYEGDVVVEYPGAHPSVVQFRDGAWQGVHKHYDLKGKENGEYEQVLGFLSSPVEVIGNIYENPELLNS